MYPPIDEISPTICITCAMKQCQTKKPLFEQVREDKSLSRTIYGSGLGNDKVTRNASNGKESEKESKRRRVREERERDGQS